VKNKGILKLSLCMPEQGVLEALSFVLCDNNKTNRLGKGGTHS
jgi:hypothetical protein